MHAKAKGGKTNLTGYDVFKPGTCSTCEKTITEIEKNHKKMTKIISTISHNISEENIWSIVYWNVNSLRMRIKNNTFFKMIEDQNPDIIFLFETMTDLKKLNRYKNGEAMKKLKLIGYNYQYEHISTKLPRK
jgi:hypothetical protein